MRVLRAVLAIGLTAIGMIGPAGTASADGVARDYQNFVSPSGNIACYVGGTGTEVRCDALETTFTAPAKPADCKRPGARPFA